MTVLVRTRPWMSSTHAWIRHAVSLSFSFVFVFLGSDSVVHATLPLFVHLPSSSQACIVGFFYPPAHHVVVVVVVRLLLLRWFLRAFGCFVTTTIQAKPRKVSLVSGGGAPPHHAGCRERKGEGWEPIPACTSQTTVHNPPLLSSPLRSIDRSMVVVVGRSGILCGRWGIGTMRSIPAEEEDQERKRTITHVGRSSHTAWTHPPPCRSSSKHVRTTTIEHETQTDALEERRKKEEEETWDVETTHEKRNERREKKEERWRRGEGADERNASCNERMQSRGKPSPWKWSPRTPSTTSKPRSKTRKESHPINND